MRGPLDPVTHAAVTTAAMPVLVAVASALGELGAALAGIAMLLIAAGSIGAPFAIPLLHSHRQPRERQSAALAFVTGLPSVAAGYALCVLFAVSWCSRASGPT